MEVVYEKHIVDKILDASVKADTEGRKIEKIMLTQKEAWDIQERFLYTLSVINKNGPTYYRTPSEIPGGHYGVLCGITLEVE